MVAVVHHEDRRGPAGAEALDGDEVTMSLNDPGKPVVLRAVGGDDYLYLLMPVRV